MLDLLFSQIFLHRFALGKLVNELVQIPNLPHEWIFDIFRPHAAYDTLDEYAIRIRVGHIEEKVAVADRGGTGFFYLCCAVLSASR